MDGGGGVVYVFGCIFLNIFSLPLTPHPPPQNEVRGQRSYHFRGGGGVGVLGVG